MCTCFATYFDKPIYGMNMDDPERERRFKVTTLKCNKKCSDKGICAKCILKNNNVLRFHCQIKNGNSFLENACMNSFGVFSNYQILVPNNEIKLEKPKSSIPIAKVFYQSQMYSKNIKDILKIIGNKTIYNDFGSGLHNMFADKNGNAIVLEASENGNEISFIKDNYIVMTNFPVYEFHEKHYTKAVGFGDDRYKIAHKEIISHKQNFDLMQGFNVLEKAKNTSEQCPTVCSMIFDPIELNVYITLFGIFDKIWKISIINNSIETFKGFNKEYKIKLGSKGILSSQLEQYMN